MVKKVFLLLLLSLIMVNPAFAERASDRTVVQVSGSSEREVVPELARIYVSVNTLNSHLEQAKTINSENMNKVFAALKTQGIMDKDIQTDTYEIDPIYNYEKDRLQTIKGYKIINRIVVTAPIEKIGVLVSEVTSAGANEISSIRFETANEKEAKDEALQDAVKDAIRKAEVIAGVLNKKIVNIKTVNESSVYYRPLIFEQRTMKAAIIDSAIPNIPAGKITVGANVQMTIELAD